MWLMWKIKSHACKPRFSTQNTTSRYSITQWCNHFSKIDRTKKSRNTQLLNRTKTQNNDGNNNVLRSEKLVYMMYNK